MGCDKNYELNLRETYGICTDATMTVVFVRENKLRVVHVPNKQTQLLLALGIETDNCMNELLEIYAEYRDEHVLGYHMSDEEDDQELMESVADFVKGQCRMDKEHNAQWNQFLEEYFNCYADPETGNRPCDDGRLCDECNTEHAYAEFQNMQKWKVPAKAKSCAKCGNVALKIRHKEITITEIPIVNGETDYDNAEDTYSKYTDCLYCSECGNEMEE